MRKVTKSGIETVSLLRLESGGERKKKKNKTLFYTKSREINYTRDQKELKKMALNVKKVVSV